MSRDPHQNGQSGRVADEVTVLVRPWYRQFYVRRGAAEWRSDEVSDEGYERGLEAVDGFMYVSTTMFGSPTRVTVRVHDEEPAIDAAAERTADTTVTGDGPIAVLNWDPSDPPVASIAVPQGRLSVRASWHGVSEARNHPDSEFGGDDTSPERVVLDVWPTEPGHA